MALSFFLDGYNIVKQVEEFSQLAIDVGRERLIRSIEKMKPHGSMRNTVTIVFDGRPGMVSPKLSTTVSVLFSYEQSADEKIKALVAQADNPRNVVVVTNDREIQSYVRGLGAVIWTVADFMNKMKGASEQHRPKVQQRRHDSKVISKSVEHKINLEFERIWLEKQKIK